MSSAVSERVFRLPDLGEGLTTAEIATWLVAEGDAVELNAPLVEVETAKATVQIPSPFAGTLTARHAEVGEELAVGAPLVTITEAAAEEPSGNFLVGYGTSGPRPRRRRAAVAAPKPPATSRRPRRSSGEPRTTPLVRKMAAELEVDLAGLAEPGTRVTRADVVQASQADGKGAGQPADNGANVVQMGPIRRAIADNVTRSRQEVPEATAWVDVDVTDLVSFHRDLKSQTSAPITLLALICRLVVGALREYPVLNARLDPQRREIHLLSDIHLGIAASTERGLVVPVLRDASRQTVPELSAALRELIDAARAGTLPPGELTGSTFTVNNFGALGVDGGDPIINQPETGILGVGRIMPRAWVRQGQVEVREVTTLVLAFDHRVCDGREAGGFLRLLADLMEDPRRVMLRW